MKKLVFLIIFFLSIPSASLSLNDLKATIQSELAKGNKSIILSEGTWQLTSPIPISGWDGIAISGEGQDVTTILVSDGVTAFINFDGQVSNVTFKDMHVKGGDSFLYSYNNLNLTVKNCRLTEQSKNGIYLEGSNVSLLDNSIDGSNQSSFSCGIWVSKSQYVTIRGNTVKNTANNGIFLANGVSYAIVEGNTLTGCHRLDSGPPAYADGGQIAVYNEDSGVYGVTVANNNISNGGSHATGIEVNGYGVTVTGNIIHGNPHSGISFYASAVNTTRVIISNNVIYNNGTVSKRRPGIWVWGKACNFILNGNICYDDRESSSKTQSYGIKIEGSSKNYIVTNNILNDNYTSGLYDLGVYPKINSGNLPSSWQFNSS